LAFLLVQLVYIYAEDERAGGDLGRLVLQEERFVQLELADLEGHFEDDLVVVVVQDSQEPLERLYGSLEIKIESEPGENIGLKVAEHLLVDVLLLLFGQEAIHAGEAG